MFGCLFCFQYIDTVETFFLYFRSSVRNERDLRWREYDVDENDEKARLIEEGKFGLLN